MSSSRPQRMLRISKACDFCHKRRIKCQDRQAEHGGRCRNCTEFDVPCTYARPSRRGRGAGSPQPAPPAPAKDASPSRGASMPLLPEQPVFPRSPLQQPRRARPPLAAPAAPAVAAVPTTGFSPPGGSITMSERTQTSVGGGDGGAAPGNERLSSTWQAFAHASTPTLKRLVGVFHETVFPIFPFFDLVRLQDRLERLEHVSNRAFFCSVMAACALASARARDGALSSCNGEHVSVSPDSTVSGSSVDMPPEMFYAAAEEALPKDILQCRDFDYLRALALLSIASIQDAKIAVMQKYIGHYFTLMAINQWHDEANWAPGMHPTEVEERRRLYWSIYTLDVFTSIIWDGCIHFQESHAKVEYPTGRAEEPGQQHGGGGGGGGGDNSNSNSNSNPNASSPSPGDPHPDSWMVGWNFTTDLYRILEHNLNKLRSRSSMFNLLGETTTPGSFRVSSQDRVADLYASLPAVFKHIQPPTGEPARDIFGFQAANIQATMALLEMVHLSLEVDVDLERKCSVVHHVLQTFHRVPKPYMRAISSPLIYHIGGIGVILGSVMEGPLSENAYHLVRDLLLSMAVLLESLEAFLHRSAGAGQRLRTLASRLEAYYVGMRNQSGQTGPAGRKDSGRDQGAHSSGSPLAGPPPAARMPLVGHIYASNGTVPAVLAQQQQQQQQQQQVFAVPPTVGQDLVPQPQPLPAAEALFNPAQASSGVASTASGDPSSWVASAGTPALAQDPSMQMFQLPDEFLQDWTWPFAVSNNYLSF